jgi:phosphoenolpyruvate carboxykinase (ATP)
MLLFFPLLQIEISSSEMATPDALARIETNGKKSHEDAVWDDDISAPVRAQNIDELHSLQKKRSAPTTPIKDGAAAAFAAALTEEQRQKQQLQSIR